MSFKDGEHPVRLILSSLDMIFETNYQSSGMVRRKTLRRTGKANLIAFVPQ